MVFGKCQNSSRIQWGLRDGCVLGDKSMGMLQQIFTGLHGGARGNGPSFISDLENGKKEIYLRNLQVLAARFGMSISKLTSRL